METKNKIEIMEADDNLHIITAYSWYSIHSDFMDELKVFVEFDKTATGDDPMCQVFFDYHGSRYFITINESDMKKIKVFLKDTFDKEVEM